jgi:hypothetical protein
MSNIENLKRITDIPIELLNKLNNEEKKYVLERNYISSWLIEMIYNQDFDYYRWANDFDIIIMQKLLS